MIVELQAQVVKLESELANEKSFTKHLLQKLEDMRRYEARDLKNLRELSNRYTNLLSDVRSLA